MSKLPGAPTPSNAHTDAETDPTQAIIFICASVAIFLVFCAGLSFTLWFCWRKSRREYDAFRRRALDDAEARKLDGSTRKQVRLPVVIINPDDDVEYGRKESRCFPARPTREKNPHHSHQSTEEELYLPNTPPPGSYYIEGMPGFFEVDLEIADSSTTTQHSDADAECPAKS